MAGRIPGLRLYDFHESGNGYQVRLLLSHIGLDYERNELDIRRGGSRTSEFLSLNPNGRIPLLVLEDGRTLAVLRFWTFMQTLDAHRHEIDERRARGEAALDVMETHLASRSARRGREA